MNLSQRIRSFLSWLDQVGEDFDPDLFKDLMEDWVRGMERTDSDLRESKQLDDQRRAVAKAVLDGKTKPTTTPHPALMTALGPDLESFLHIYTKVFREDPLDEYFTSYCLNKVPEYVKRAHRLESVAIPIDPGFHVVRYFRQASWCYIFGLYDAVAVLSRAVIEAALEAAPGIATAMTRRQGAELEDLVDTARFIGVLDEPTASAAHAVRRLGNDAIHLHRCDEQTNQLAARNSIKQTVLVLRRLHHHSDVAPSDA